MLVQGYFLGYGPTVSMAISKLPQELFEKLEKIWLLIINPLIFLTILITNNADWACHYTIVTKL